jgi:hypothetical protein
MSEHPRGTDPHRLVRFLDGECDETERAQTLSELVALPNEQIVVLADAAAVLRANEQVRTEQSDERGAP